MRRTWISLLAVVLAGYAIINKGFAYIGVPPLFIGEIMLFGGVVILLYYNTWWRLLAFLPVLAILGLMLCGLTSTLPYIQEYKIDALKDGVIWAYAIFALCIADCIIAHPELLNTIIKWYHKFAGIFLVCIPVVFVVWWPGFGASIPNWPWAASPILWLKAGDAQMHCTAILAFMVAGLYGRFGTWSIVLLILNVALLGTVNRGGLLAFLLGSLVCLIYDCRSRILWRFCAIAVLGLVLAIVFDVRYKNSLVDSDTQRDISATQLIVNVLSLSSDTGSQELANTKEWRLNLWEAIINYTLYGKYFWTGKGCGINLLEDVGYDSVSDGTHPVRSPHNCHMTVLARMGVPGLCLWLVVHLGWVWLILVSMVRSWHAGEQRWVAFFFWIFNYWMAIMINASFDVVLEGPQGGIWYWTVYGIGLAGLWIHQEQPNVFTKHSVPSRLVT